MELTEKITLDDAARVRRTRDGYLVAMPRVARTGIQLYSGSELGKPELDVVRVYRPEQEVFNKDSLHSYSSRPVTNDHPPVQVTKDNWKKFSVGHTGEDIVRDGEAIRVPLVLMDADVIRDFENGKRELSLGYTTDIKWEKGIAPNGEEYDAVQTNIRANHLAVVAAARGGPELRIGDKKEDTTMSDKMKTILVDGIELTMSDIAAAVVQRALNTMNSRIAKLQAKLDEESEEEKEDRRSRDRRRGRDEEEEEEKRDRRRARDVRKRDEEEEEKEETSSDRRRGRDVRKPDEGEEETSEAKDALIATLRKQLEDAKLTPSKLDALVKERADVVAKAQTILGDELVVDGKTTADIRRQAVNKVLGDKAKGWSEEQVSASFDALTASVESTNGASGLDSMRKHFAQAPAATKVSDAEKAYMSMVQDLTNAWKSPARAN